MGQFIIQGGAKISGQIDVQGAKNHALKVIPATLLFSDPVTIHNIPNVEDVNRMLEILEEIGAEVNRIDDHTVTIHAPESFSGELSETLVPKLRASIVLTGPILARYGAVSIPLPGGDNIGKRPINFFDEGLFALGARVSVEKHRRVYEAPDGLHGGEYTFPVSSHTGTETLMLAAVAASGTTVLYNAATEPEVVALAEWLIACGASIHGHGTSTITIEGGTTLHAQEATVIPDRLEAGSFAILAAATNSALTIAKCDPTHLRVPLSLLERIGVTIHTTETTLEVESHGKLEPFDLVTHEYPGFPTDLQAPMTVLLTQADGVSTIRETIYEGRLFYTDLLNNMGASITLEDAYRATVHGSSSLVGAAVNSPDIRAGIAMIIAAAIAEGETTIDSIYQIDRGYEAIDERLRSIGMDIQRTE